MATVEKYLVWAASTMFISIIILLVLRKHQREALFSYLPIPARDRRISTSKTPPRSVSPDQELCTPASSSINFKDNFAPSRREALMTIAETLPLDRRNRLQGLALDEIDFRKGLIPFGADYRECGPSTYLPTEISVDEARALGDFPNYAELSGVPLPEAYKEFRIETARARPYRPFRWAYHQTMSLTKLEPNWWLELTLDYATRIGQRKELYQKYGPLVLDYLPGTELACKEIMEMVLQFLCARYPHYFSLTDHPATGYIFQNRILGNETVISSLHPLIVLLHNIPEDFAVMMRNPEDGMYYFRAGLLCSALGWNVKTKLGLQLKEIHQPIPDYKEKLQFSMDRYFSKLPTSCPIQRGSWGLEVDNPLFMPPGDPHEQYRLAQFPPSTLPLSRIHLRVDWQTLRRLPLSGAIVFNFKALFTPVAAFRHEPYIPALLLKILREGKKEIMQYKNTWHVEHVVLPELEAWKAEQERDGVVQPEWEERTLGQTPFFEGWEGGWHREQGF